MGQARCWEPNTSRRICSPGVLRSLSGSSRDKRLSLVEYLLRPTRRALQNVPSRFAGAPWFN